MPVSQNLGSQHARDVAEILEQWELDQLEAAALALRGDQTRDEWAATALERIRVWRHRADRGVSGALRELGKAVRTALAGAEAEGAAAALADLPGVDTVGPLGIRGVDLDAQRLGTKLASALQQTPGLLERSLREAVRVGVEQVTAGTHTRRSGAQQVLDKLIRQGITGFRDSKGRNWSLTSYVEMAVRTETQARALAAGDKALELAGLDLVIVSDSPRECPLCRPFEGKVLSLGDEEGTVTRPNELGGPPVTIKITSTLAQARSQGFQHPNCTHSYSGYIPGVTQQGGAQPNPEGYKQKQKQRAMERKIRALKRARVLAIDDEAKAQANANLRMAQKQLREYVKEHGLKRQSGRESIKHAV